MAETLAARTDDIRRLMGKIDLSLQAEYVRTVTAELIAQFVEVSGDAHRLHTDTAYAATTPYGRVVAHGAMLIGFMSTASTIISDTIEEATGLQNVSLGYDRIRFPAPVFAGDTITTRIRISETQFDKLRLICEETSVNQAGVLVGIASHVLKFI